MRQIGWTPKSLRAYKRLVCQNPQLRVPIEETLCQLAIDPFHPTLKTHKLKGQLAGSWACTVEYDCRIVFDFIEDIESGDGEILLLDIGSHDEVY